MVDVTGFPRPGSTLGVDLLSLSDQNFWYMGILARNASGPTYVAGNTSFNQSRDGAILLFEGAFTASNTYSADPVYSVSILDGANNRRVQLDFAPGFTEDDLRRLEGRSDLEAFTVLLSGGDTFTLTEDRDAVSGHGGNDLIYGGAQADNLFGGDGADTLIGGAGFDRLFGEDGDDLLQDFEGPGGQFGGAGDDTLQGGAAATAFYGQIGNDVIEAGGGDDRIGAGAGFDRVDGGGGDDLMFGDFNADTFVFADGHGTDTIGDFDALNDFERIDLTSISATTDIADLNLGSASLGAATQAGDDVLIDTGNGTSILLRNVSLADLDANDFLF